jgi:hypothetical protein
LHLPKHPFFIQKFVLKKDFTFLGNYLIGFDPKISLLADGKSFAIKFTVLFDKKIKEKAITLRKQVCKSSPQRVFLSFGFDWFWGRFQTGSKLKTPDP